MGDPKRLCDVDAPECFYLGSGGCAAPCLGPLRAEVDRLCALVARIRRETVEEAVRKVSALGLMIGHGEYVVAAIRSLLPAAPQPSGCQHYVGKCGSPTSCNDQDCPHKLAPQPSEPSEEEDSGEGDDPACDAAYAAYCRADDEEQMEEEKKAKQSDPTMPPGVVQGTTGAASPGKPREARAVTEEMSK